MECPQCGQPLLIASYPVTRMMRGPTSVVTRAHCCGYGVRLVPCVGCGLLGGEYTVEAVPRNTERDSFGQLLKKE